MRTVLVVDHSRVARAVARRCLAAFSCRVVEAADGAEGMAAARREPPDLIIARGEALGMLLDEPSCRDVPVVVLRAGGDRGVVPRRAYPYIAGHLVQPFSRRAFEEAVTGVLGIPAAVAADEEPGCTVLHLPDPRVTAADDLLESAIRALAQGGRDTLILDLGRVTEVNTELVAQVVRAITAARGAGMRTAICAPDARVRAGLGRVADTRDTPCEATRGAVRERLAGTW